MNLTQLEMGRRIGASSMAISRWERGLLEPPSNIYIILGRLAGDPLCWFFWGRAGLSASDIARVLPAAQVRWGDAKIANINLVQAGAGTTHAIQAHDFVAIPVLPILAATLGAEGDRVSNLDQLAPESMWAAPAQWCPNPAATISFRVAGNSMSPVILDGYVVAVDTSQVCRDELVGKIVVAFNREDERLLLSRLIRFDHTEALISDQRQNVSVLIGDGSPWRIVGKVVWWAGKAS